MGSLGKLTGKLALVPLVVLLAVVVLFSEQLEPSWHGELLEGCRREEGADDRVVSNPCW